MGGIGGGDVGGVEGGGAAGGGSGHIGIIGGHGGDGEAGTEGGIGVDGGGGEGGGGDGAANACIATEGAVTLSIVTPSCDDSVAAGVACIVAAAAFAADALDMIIRALMLTLAAVTVRVMSSAPAMKLKRESLKAVALNELVSPEAVKPTLTMGLYEAPGLAGGRDGGTDGG